MPEVLSGTRNTVTLNELRTRMANFLGLSPNDNRLKAMVLEWLNEVLLEITSNDPLVRRLKVVDAEAVLFAGSGIVDVRISAEDGGFGWDNCEQVDFLMIPALSQVPLEPLSIEQHRNRSSDVTTAGIPQGVVFIDQFRIKCQPPPNEDYDVIGDFYQHLPKVTDGAQGIDFPTDWNSALVQGVKSKGLEWLHQAQPGAYVPQQKRFDRQLDSLRENERMTPVRPGAAVSTRSLRGRRTPHDNSTDMGSWARVWR